MIAVYNQIEGVDKGRLATWHRGQLMREREAVMVNAPTIAWRLSLEPLKDAFTASRSAANQGLALEFLIRHDLLFAALLWVAPTSK